MIISIMKSIRLSEYDNIIDNFYRTDYDDDNDEDNGDNVHIIVNDK